MSTVCKFLVFMALITALSFVGTPALAADEAPEAVVLIPDRMVMVEYGFNLASLRDVLLVSYRSYEPRNPMLLHVWNGMKWAPVSHEEYRSGGFLPGAPKTVIAIGDQTTMLPDLLAAAPEWCQNYKHITTLNIGDVVNETGTILGFKDREWKKLAKIYDLSIVDLNAERRKYGKYGPPAAEKKPPAKKEEAPVDTLTPVPVSAAGEEKGPLTKTSTPVIKTAPAVNVEAPKIETPKPAPVKKEPVKPAPAPKAPTPTAKAPVPTVVYGTDDMPLGSETIEPADK